MLLLAALVSMGGLALAAPALARRLGRDAGYMLAAGFVGVGGLLVWAAPGALAGDVVTASWAWMPTLDVSFTLRLDGLTSLFCLLVLGVGALIMAYCPRYLSADGRHGTIYFLLTAFGGAMLGLVLAGDLVLLYVFWEATTVISYFLIGTAGGKGVAPAKRALLVTAMGGLALLAAVVLLAITVGSTDIATVLAARRQVLDSPAAGPVAALLIIAACTKSAQVPFHFWLPGAMVAITPVSAYLHAATMVKAGIYLLLRFSTIYAGQFGWSLTLTGIGLVTALLGAVLALRQHDLKALLAYSTVSQLGLLVAAIGVGTTIALAAAILHTFAHALFKATLFMLVGIIDREAGSRDIRRLSGLMRVMPITATLTALAGLSMAGVIPLLGFVSKEFLFQGFASTRIVPGAGWVAGTLAVAASALTFAYSVRIFAGPFTGPTVQLRLFEPSWAFLAPAAVAAVAGLVLGPAVAVLNPLVRQAIVDVEPWATPLPLEFWHGASIELLMSLITIVLGSALFLAGNRIDPALRRFPQGVGERLFDRGYEALIRFGALVGGPDRGDATAAFLSRPIAGIIILGAVGLLTIARPDPGPPSRPEEWVVVGLLAVAVAGMVVARRALGAVALLGTVGLIVTVWFLLAGGPDVALTLLLVEVLTAMVAAFVLRGRSRHFPRPGGRGALAAGAAAVLAGAAATAGTLALTGHRELSAAGAFFLSAAEPETGGRNVVNTILVDFRGLDTLGEASVLAAVALGLLLLVPGPENGGATRAAPYGAVLGPAYRLIAPILAALSAYLFLRGHQEPGGGFIAALVAGIAVAFAALIGRLGVFGPLRLRTRALLTAGLLLTVCTGLAVQAAGSPFLTPVKASFTVPVLGAQQVSSSLLFDLGVYLLVLGMMVATVGRLGGHEAGHR